MQRSVRKHDLRLLYIFPKVNVCRMYTKDECSSFVRLPFDTYGARSRKKVFVSRDSGGTSPSERAVGQKRRKVI